MEKERRRKRKEQGASLKAGSSQWDHEPGAKRGREEESWRMREKREEGGKKEDEEEREGRKKERGKIGREKKEGGLDKSRI